MLHRGRHYDIACRFVRLRRDTGPDVVGVSSDKVPKAAGQKDRAEACLDHLIDLSDQHSGVLQVREHHPPREPVHLDPVAAGPQLAADGTDGGQHPVVDDACAAASAISR